MAPPVLLVADDLSTIAAVKRVLGREGYEVILATSAADAVIAWGHHLPGLVVLQPSVESDRGAVVLEELQQHPDAQLLRVVLLGDGVPGFSYVVQPLPLDGERFAKTVQSQMRAAEVEQDWTVSEPPTDTTPAAAPPRLDEPEPWRATRPHEDTREAALPPEAPLPDAAPTPPHAPEPLSASQSVMTKLFGDLPSLEDELHKDVEAQVMASVESSLPPLGADDAELQRLEDEVRAEAARRRAAREARPPAMTPPPVAPVTDEAPPEPSNRPDETSFADIGTTPPDGSTDPTSDETPTATLPTHSGAAAPLDTATAREVLARAEAISLESRAVAQSQLKAAEAEARRGEAELEAMRRRAEHAESLVRRERESRAGTEDQLEHLRDETRQLTARLDTEREEAQQRFASDLEAVTVQAEERRVSLQRAMQEQLGQLEFDLAQHRDELEARNAALEALRQQLDTTERSLEAVNASAVERAAERESLLSSLTHEQEAARRFEEKSTLLEQERAALQNDLEAVRSQLEAAATRVRELTAQLDDERLGRMGVEEQRDELTQKLERADSQAVEVEGALSVTKGELESVLADLDETRARLERAGTELASSLSERTEVGRTLTSLTAEREALTAEVARLTGTSEQVRGALEAETARREGLMKDLTSLKEAVELQRARADEAEVLAQLSVERLKALEHRQVMSLALPGRRALGVPRHGTVSLEQLAALVSTLVAAQADVRLELGVRGGTRTLWFKKGALQGAESSFDHESLIDRARRDGLIDARQEAELRLLRTATASEQLDAMKGRGYLREIETVPLLQRGTEHVALEAFAEESTQYRLSDEPPASTVLQVAVPRSTLPLVAEALRRAVPADALLERLGGAEAVCTPTENDVDLRAMGFTDRERKMLSWVDGEATVEDLALASGLKSEASFRALLVAKLLGVIEVNPPAVPAPAPSADLDLRRLEAKFDEVQDADYFTILGLPRAATSDDVQRAFRRLSEEFDPLKYTGHPDASLQQRAQVVSSLIEEAARALEDERRRAEYARHLLD
jgi:hypothetical protein